MRKVWVNFSDFHFYFLDVTDRRATRQVCLCTCPSVGDERGCNPALVLAAIPGLRSGTSSRSAVWTEVFSQYVCVLCNITQIMSTTFPAI